VTDVVTGDRLRTFIPVAEAASLSAAEVLATLGTTDTGLATQVEATRRRAAVGPNAVTTIGSRRSPQ
jgi:Cation transporter/ATPase, N-terminus